VKLKEENYNAIALCLILFGIALLLFALRQGIWFYSQSQMISERSMAEIMGWEKVFWEPVKGVLGAATLWLGVRLRREQKAGPVAQFSALWGGTTLLYGAIGAVSSLYPLPELGEAVDYLLLVIFGSYLFRLGRKSSKEGIFDLRLGGTALIFLGAYYALNFFPLGPLSLRRAGAEVQSFIPELFFALAVGLLAVGVILRLGRNTETLPYGFYILGLIPIKKALLLLSPLFGEIQIFGHPYFYTQALIAGAVAGLAYLALTGALINLGRKL